MNSDKRNISRLKYVLCPIVGYCLVVLIFAVVYWATFRLNSTSFVISEQMNRRIDRYDLLEDGFDFADYHSNVKDDIPITVEGISKQIEPALSHLSLLNDSLRYCRERIDFYEKQLDSIYAVIDKTRTEAIDAFVTNQMQACQNRIDSLRRIMDQIDSTRLIMEGKLVEMAHLELEYAVRKKDVYENVIKNYQSFVPISLLDTMWYYWGKDLSLSMAVDRENREIVENL